MANSKLQGKSWQIPKELHDHLKKTMRAYKGEENVEGFQRLQNLINNPNVSYEELKRIKNFFDTQSGNTDYMDDKKQSTPFILNGGRKMKSWVNSTLDLARDTVSGGKKIKTDTAMIGSHYRDTDSMNIRHSTDDIKLKTSHQKKISESEYIYEIKKMQNIISIFDKNKELCQTDNKSPQS